MKNKGVGIQAVFLLCLIMVLMAGCAAPKKVSEASGSAKKTVDIDTSGDSVKVGILHSLSGTMAISEVSVHDAELIAIQEINQKGGVLGKKLEPVVEDGASDWPTYAEKMRKLLQQDKVAAVFGGWTSASRKAMLPVVEQNNGLLFYPVQYEGMETSPNIFYTGATTNQQIVPAVDWLLKNKGKKFFLIGSDYVFPRTANKIIKAQVKADGGEIAGEEYTPLGHTNYSTLVSKIKEKQPDVIFNTLNGDSNVAFFKQLKDAGISADDMPVMSASVAEEEIRGIGPDVLKGHYAVWNYFQTTNTSENQTFVKNYKKMNGDSRVTSDPIEAGYNAVYLWAAAVEKAKSFDVDKVKKAADGISFKAPGGTVKIDGDTQHLYKTVRIGQITGDGQFKEVWNSGEPVKPDPYLKTYDWAKGLSK
ncbi:urea ABC transporter substrate-binding protein [Bacillus stercoris]|uniref:urea ABC transporter substrate-binding protein n=1 Tax=Bacillus stercoris TaxID=2054641 RepID=UPI001455FAB9|nr:urea ABC transporter substrate-binding protein [Bacillus stercoris]MCM2581220.1 urea ABC transporter substrate-binding protein [Bacillus stercoris]MDZ5671466.1 urea ABC transporter substrate-binding protein [Bacillus stercoris]MEC2060802.1 urea ABC transporter substrate-binding protein [Bacillus stercoris]NLS41903.1 urea ABC transporter substrate-binding protein [Bacillus subtilis]